jgi:hypothetical protein
MYQLRHTPTGSLVDGTAGRARGRAWAKRCRHPCGARGSPEVESDERVFADLPARDGILVKDNDAVGVQAVFDWLWLYQVEVGIGGYRGKMGGLEYGPGGVHREPDHVRDDDESDRICTTLMPGAQSSPRVALEPLTTIHVCQDTSADPAVSAPAWIFQRGDGPGPRTTAM